MKEDFDCDDLIRFLPFISGLWKCLDKSSVTKLNRDLTNTNPKVPAEHLDFFADVLECSSSL